MKIYIAGPMTGYKDLNYPAFFAAEKIIRDLGHEPINPARLDMIEDIEQALVDALASIDHSGSTGHSWEYYMRRDLPQLLLADAVCLLPDWMPSRGARLEVQLAHAMSMPLYVIKDGLLTPRVQLIGLFGFRNSGKDEVADHLANKGWKKAAFAERIRTSLYALNPRVTADSRVSDYVDKFDWDIAKTTSPEINALLQRLGTEVGRDKIGENIWIDLTLSDLPDGHRVVLTDVRFPNEAKRIQALGGQVWHITSDITTRVNDHASELAMADYPNFDATFAYNGPVETLLANVDKALEASGYGSDESSTLA